MKMPISSFTIVLSFSVATYFDLTFGSRKSSKPITIDDERWVWESRKMIPMCDSSADHIKECIQLTKRKLSWQRAHDYCRKEGGFLPKQQEMVDLPDGEGEEFWTSLTNVGGHFQWLSRNPEFAELVSWNEGTKPVPWNSQCPIFNRRTNKMSLTDCQRMVSFICLVEKAQEGDPSKNIELRISTNWPDESGWIEIPRKNFSQLFLKCSVTSMAANNVKQIRTQQVYWTKDDIYLDHNDITIHLSAIRDPSKKSLSPHDPPPKGFYEYIQQGTYCCETWVPYSSEIVRSNCVQVTFSNVTTLIVKAVVNHEDNVTKALSHFNQSNSSSWLTNMPMAFIRMNKLFETMTKYEYKFHLYVPNTSSEDINIFIDEMTKSIQNNSHLQNESSVVYSTYCFEKKISLGFGNEIKLPFAKAGYTYDTPFKCEINKNRLAFHSCRWNFTDGASITSLANTCLRYDMCPKGYQIIGGRVCVEIIKNVNWKDGHMKLYQTGSERTLFEEEAYFKEFRDEVSLHHHILDFLTEAKIYKVWLPLRRKYDFTPIIDHSVNYNIFFKNIFDGNSFSKLNWVPSHPVGIKNCLGFSVNQSTLFTDDCHKTFNFIKLIDISEFRSNPLLLLDNMRSHSLFCPAGWYRVTVSSEEQVCLKVFHEVRYSYWKGAKNYCQSEGGSLANPARDFLDWEMQTLLNGNETSWTNINMELSSTFPTTVDYLNWLPETNYSKKYGIISKRGWFLVDEQDERTHVVICERKISTGNKRLKLTLEPLESLSSEQVQQVSFSKPLCVRAEPVTLLRPQSIRCLKNGVEVDLHCTKWKDCQCTLNLTQQGYYECFAWAEVPFGQVWSPNFRHIDNKLVTYVITGTDNVTSYNPLTHDSTFIEKNKLSKLDPPCMKALYRQMSNEDQYIDFTQIYFSSNGGTFQYSFHLQCKQSYQSFCNSKENVLKKLNQVLMNEPDVQIICAIQEVRSTVGCSYDVTFVTNGSLTWPLTKSSGRFLPKELCITIDDEPVSRLCEGNFISGYKWLKAPLSCPKNPSKQTKGLWEISNDPKGYLSGNYSSTISNLTMESESITAADFLYVASSMDAFAQEPKIDEKLEFSDVVSTMNNMMGAKNSTVSLASEKFNTTSTLLVSFEKLSFLTNSNSANAIAKVSRKRLSVGCVDVLQKPSIIGYQSGFSTESKLLSTEDEIERTYLDAAIILPKNLSRDALVNLSREGDPKQSSQLLFVVYKSSSLFYDPSSEFKINSYVIQASFQDIHVANLKNEGVKIYLRPKYVVNQSTTQCVFWDFQKNNKKGGWSGEGCEQIDFLPNLVTCECDHLTSFALLMNYDTSYTLAPIHVYMLGLISTIGCGLSIFGLSLVLLTFVLFDKFRKSTDNKILTNLSFAILMSLIIFIAGIQQTWNAVLCRAVAVSLHYFILASFAWMFIESVHQYFKFVKVCGYYIPRFIWKASIFAWGTPIIPILAFLVLDSELYYNKSTVNICWISSAAFLYSFAPPVALVLLLNAIMYIMIINGAIISRRKLASTQDQKQLLISQMSMAICVFFLLGFTWTFGFLSFSYDTIAFSYLFCLFNTLQGFFIFFFHLYRNRNARKLWISFMDGSHSIHSSRSRSSQYSNSSSSTRASSRRSANQARKYKKSNQTFTSSSSNFVSTKITNF